MPPLSSGKLFAMLVSDGPTDIIISSNHDGSYVDIRQSKPSNGNTTNSNNNIYQANKQQYAIVHNNSQQ